MKRFTKSTDSSQLQASGGSDIQNDLSHLLEMGFDHEQSLEALQASNYDLTTASAMLAQQSADFGLSSTPTKDSVIITDAPTMDDDSDTRRKDKG